MMIRLFWFHMRKRLPLSLVAGLLMGLISAASLLVYDPHSIEMIAELRAAAPFPSAVLGLGGSISLVDHLRSLAFGFVLPLIGFAFVIACARRLIAAKVASGELAYYLALPVRRATLVLVFAGVLLACTLLMVLVQAAVSAAAAALLHPQEMNLLWYAWLNLGLLLQLLVTGAIGLMFSAGSDEARPAGRRAWLLSMLLFVIAMLSRAQQMPGFLRYLGIYSLVDLQALSTGRPDLFTAAPLLFMLLCLLIGIRRFSGRDLAL